MRKNILLPVLLLICLHINATDFDQNFSINIYDEIEIVYHITYSVKRTVEVVDDNMGNCFGGGDYGGPLYGLNIPESVTHNGKTYSVTAIRQGAFFDHHCLQEVKLPSSVTKIGKNAFAGCHLLYSCNLPAALDSIGEGAFSGSGIGKEIYIPKSVNYIGERAFLACSHLCLIAVDADNPNYCCIDSILYNKEASRLIHCPCTKRVAHNIPSTLKRIDPGAFSYAGITSISLPNSLTEIGDAAFGGCANLTSISIPNSVKKIGATAFGGCTKMKCIDLPTYLKKIDDYTFNGCSELSSISIPKGVCYIGKNAFSFSGLKSISLPNSVAEIGKSVFESCDSLQSITLSPSLKKIGDKAFFKCANLSSIVIPKSVTEMGIQLFSDCPKLKKVTILGNISEIKEQSFSRCHNLTEVNLPKTLKSIGWNAFAECNLPSVVLPDSLNLIYMEAFAGCNMSSIRIPNSVTHIYKSAFQSCKNLKTIYLPNIPIQIGETAFENTQWFNKQKDGLVYLGKTAYTYKGKLRNDTSIIIKDGTLNIGDNCFINKMKVKSITLPNSVKTIGDFAFDNTGIQSLVIPDSVTFIGLGALSSCVYLHSVTLGKLLKRADGYFLDSGNLKTIVCKAITPPSINLYCFQYVQDTYPQKITLFVADESVEAYKKAIGWNVLQNIKGISEMSKTQ